MSPRVVIAGGGIAAFEAALALRDWVGDAVDVELLCPHRGFVYRPLAVAEPFGLTPRFEIDTQGFARDLGASYRPGELASVDPAAKTVATAAGDEIGYDHLIVATGARTEPALNDAFAFTGPDAVAEYSRLLYRLERGVTGSLVFTVPEGPRWLLPIYELALMTAVFARARLAQPSLYLVTPEARPLEYFGVETGREVIAVLEEWGVELVPEHRAIRFEKPHLETDRGYTIVCDEVVSLPRLRGRAIAGLPCDEDGFVEVSSHVEVPGCEGVFAAGDATTFPIKHGGIAAQQADAAAEAIAADRGVIAAPSPFAPTLDAMLLSGEVASRLHRSIVAATESAPRTQVGETWWPLEKVQARYLSTYLADRAGMGSTSAAIEPGSLADELKASHERRYETRVGEDAPDSDQPD